MAERLNRKELYDLVWSDPMKTLPARFGISDAPIRSVTGQPSALGPSDPQEPILRGFGCGEVEVGRVCQSLTHGSWARLATMSGGYRQRLCPLAITYIKKGSLIFGSLCFCLERWCHYCGSEFLLSLRCPS
jgi:hypothetical protein